MCPLLFVPVRSARSARWHRDMAKRLRELAAAER